MPEAIAASSELHHSPGFGFNGLEVSEFIGTASDFFILSGIVSSQVNGFLLEFSGMNFDQELFEFFLSQVGKPEKVSVSEPSSETSSGLTT